MRFKINIPVRMKNPWFWVGLAGVILTAMGVSPETLTSWGAVVEAFKSFIMNPFMLGSVALAVLGVFIDPTTKSLGDSANALTYTSPN
jgi:phi LC3 family holin|nr:MAG TPA: holin [Caudoviricetes sp.]